MNRVEILHDYYYNPDGEWILLKTLLYKGHKDLLPMTHTVE